MRPLLHPTLVNGRTGDPVLYVETLFERRAILFDLGDLSNLPARKLQRLEHIFVSHAHIDHSGYLPRLSELVQVAFSQRRKLLDYLKSRNADGYRTLIEKLGLRK